MAEPDRAPLRADAERNRQRLLDAGREVYAARGLDVTLDEIARHAGVGTGTAYRNFANKNALIEELMVDRVGDLEAIARELLEEPDPWLSFTGYFERALAMQAADRGLKDIMFSPGRGLERVAEARARLAAVVSQIVERAVAAGVLRSDLVVTDVAVIGYMLNALVDFGRDVEPELYRRYLAVVLDGLRPRPESAGPLPVAPLDLQQLMEAMANAPRP
jgi:AcrR family transcriptional regulator